MFPTGYMLWFFDSSSLILRCLRQNPPDRLVIFLKPWTSTGYFSNPTSSFVTNWPAVICNKALTKCSWTVPPTEYGHSSKSTLTPEWEFFVIRNQLWAAHDFGAQGSRTQWPAQNPSWIIASLFVFLHLRSHACAILVKLIDTLSHGWTAHKLHQIVVFVWATMILYINLQLWIRVVHINCFCRKLMWVVILFHANFSPWNNTQPHDVRLNLGIDMGSWIHFISTLTRYLKPPI